MTGPATAQDDHDGRRLATLQVTADHCGVGERTIRRWVSKGRLTAYRLGPRIVRIDLNEVDQRLCKPIPVGRE